MTLVNRWYQLLKLLVTHKKVSIQEVQKEIKTSNQTIKKDIGELNEEIAGIAKIIQKNKHFELEIYDRCQQRNSGQGSKDIKRDDQ